MKKAPGIDKIQNEHLRYAGQKLHVAIVRLFNVILLIGYTPESWKKALIVPIYKGGSKPTYRCDSYRPVALLPSSCKLFESVLYKRIFTWSDLY